jgi:hypothetical protein
MLQIFRNNYSLIFDYAIYGERHSGTNFLEQCIHQKFQLNRTRFYGDKHFFGWAKPETITYKGKHTLFIGIVRNPYDWIISMFNMPHHAHPHHRYDIKTYITHQWLSVDINLNEILADRNFYTNERYKNIFEMRKTKYSYLSEDMPFIAQNYVLISYEYFLHNHYRILDTIGKKFYLPSKGIPPDKIHKSPYNMTSEIKSIIDTNIDWQVEETLGYFPK